MMPIIGQYTISDVAKISSLLHERYGRIVRFSGLIGRPDLLFIYDADEIEKVSNWECEHNSAKMAGVSSLFMIIQRNIS